MIDKSLRKNPEANVQHKLAYLNRMQALIDNRTVDRYGHLTIGALKYDYSNQINNAGLKKKDRCGQTN